MSAVRRAPRIFFVLFAASVLVGCAVIGGSGTPTPEIPASAYRNAQKIAKSVIIVVDPRFTAIRSTPSTTYKKWTGNGWGTGTYTIDSGRGLAESLRDFLPRLFDQSTVVGSLGEALSPRPDWPKADLIVRVRPVNISLDDVQEKSSASVAVGLDVFATDGTPFGEASAGGSVREIGESTDYVFMEVTIGNEPGAKERSAILSRLTRALGGAFGIVAEDIPRRLVASGALDRAAKAGPNAFHDLVLRYAAAVECGRRSGKSAAEVKKELHVDEPVLSVRLEAPYARLTPAERFEAVVRACQDPAASYDDLFRSEMARIDAAIVAEEFPVAREAIQRLLAEEPQQADVLSRVSALEVAVRTVAEREAKRRAEEEAKRQADEAERAAAEAKRQADAAVIAADAKKALKANKDDKARALAMEALTLVPNQPEAANVIWTLDRKSEERARKERAAASARLKAQVPGYIARCKAAKHQYQVAEQGLRRAAASGQPSLVQAMSVQKSKAAMSFNEAQSQVKGAIQVYLEEGQRDAAQAVRNAARDCF